MVGTINMQEMRYINLFSKITKISTMNCFLYNNQIIFAVPRSKVSIAIGKDAVNVRKLRGILGRKIRVVAMPAGEDFEGVGKFIEEVVSPVEFIKVDVKDNSVVITAGRQSKASLIGRKRVREKELSSILKDAFGILKFKIA
jgi:NusA-like KH domain protein